MMTEEQKQLISQDSWIPKRPLKNFRDPRLEEELEMHNQLTKKWIEKSDEVYLFKSLLASKSNIFVHGANGTGKTTFVQDVIGTHRDANDEFMIYIDCIEFNSEKLVASAISQQLNARV